MSSYTRTAAAASQLLDLRLSSIEHAHAALSEVDVPDSAYGNLAGSARFSTAHRQTMTDVAYTVELLGQALEGDADRLYRVGFALQSADSGAAARSQLAGGR